RSVGDCEVVVLALEVARKAVVEHGELRIIATESMIIIWGPGPIRGNLPRKGWIAGKDQNGRAIHALMVHFLGFRSQQFGVCGGDAASRVFRGIYFCVPLPCFPEAAAARAARGALVAPFWSASSTAARRSTSMRKGWPEEYSAWNITFQDWQIMRRRTIGSSAENWARRQSTVGTPRRSSSRRPSWMAFRSSCMRRKNIRRIMKLNRTKATMAAGSK